VTRADETRREFTLQAEALATAATFLSPDLARRLRDALGERRRGRILDLACGPGVVCESLAAEAEKVVGVDLTPEMIRRARARCAAHPNAEFREAAVEALPFRDGEFGAVVTRLSLHHFEEPRAALREARRVIAPGGRLVVIDLVSSEDREEARLHDALETLRDPSHVRFLSPSGLREVVSVAGFEIRAEERWDQPREFGEWAAIVAAARSLAPLEPVMAALARAGVRAGIDLREDADGVRFTHHWMLVAADPVSPDP
jgi:ubiquinone/menaquinone biosynthesis C-methylase UbiE